MLGKNEFCGIVLAGGSGTRLYPVTKGVSKQLLPIYDKPMVFYPLSVLMLAGIRDIMVITTREDLGAFKRLIGDGSEFGIRVKYAVQEKPNGIAEAFVIGDEFIGDSNVCLILGDNVFYGSMLTQKLKEARKVCCEDGKAVVFAKSVKDPNRFGVAEVDADGRCISIEEKPKNPKSDLAVVGLYFYPNDVVNKAREVKPSGRGELEITSVNSDYLSENRLSCVQLERGFYWADTGTFDSLLDASNYMRAIEKQQGVQVACLKEISLKNGWI